MSAPHHISKEAKPHSSGLYVFRKVARGYGRSRVRYGEIHAHKAKFGGSRLTIYWAHRRPDHIFRSDNTWAVDVATVEALAPYAVTHIGIQVLGGEKLLIRKSDLTDKLVRAAKGIVVRNYENHVGTAPGAKGKQGALQYYIPVEAFSRFTPPKATNDDALIQDMRIGSKSRKKVQPTVGLETDSTEQLKKQSMSQPTTKDASR